MRFVKLTLHNGQSFHLTGSASSVAEQINEARGSGKLVALETTAIPTGQMVHIDPDLVASIRND